MEEKEVNISSMKSVAADEIIADETKASDTAEHLDADAPLTFDIQPENIKNNNSETVFVSPATDRQPVHFGTASETPNNHKNTNADTDDDGIVFAEIKDSDKKGKRSSIKQKKRIPAAAVIAAAAAVLCIGAVGAVIVTANNQSVPVSTQPENTVAEESAVSDTAVNSNEKAVPTQVSIAETSFTLLGTDKSNIKFGKDVTVEGIDLSGKTLSQSFDAMQKKLLDLREEISITAQSGSKTCVLTQDDFEFDSNLANVLLQAYHFSRGELTEPTVETITVGNKTDFKVTTVINQKSIDNAVKKAAKEFDIQPVNAHVKKFDPYAKEKFTYADGTNGFLVDQTELKNDILDILSQSEKKGSFSIEAKETKYKISIADVKANTKLIASHRTTAANVYNSNANMELAIKAASGTEVKPGETFSFNEMTGDTTNGYEHTYSNGVVGSYLPSTAIVNGKYEQQYGGGICQASTTLYNCAMKADMEPVERHAHQFPSSYADYGLDATVDYGNLDMKFKNTKEYSVFIATYVYDSNGDGLDELNVEMYGPISTEYDEIVTVGWVYYAGDYTYGAKGAKVYFKNGKEVKRTILPAGDYDYHYDSYYSAVNMIPGDPDNGPSVSPSGTPPTIYSPNGCGSCGPIKYGTAAAVLRGAVTAAAQSGSDGDGSSIKVTTENADSSKQESSKQESSKSEDSDASNDNSSTSSQED